MTAPAAVARGVPAGIKLENGWKSLVAFSLNPTLSVWEIECTPPPSDTGDMIDTTTQHNNDVRTKAPRTLVDDGEGTFTFAYDPVCRTQIRALLGRKGTITHIYPDGSTYSLFGAVRMVEFDALVEGTMPTGTLTYGVTNTDPVSKAEEPPVMVEVAGT